MKPGRAQKEVMRTVTYGAACTLDGFIAGNSGEIDWLHFSKDVSTPLAWFASSRPGQGKGFA
jgi:hypothetical protein